MKHNFLSLMLAGTIISAGVLAAPTVFAQENPLPDSPFEHQFNREEFREKMSQKIAQDLELTEEQQQKAKEIREQGQKDIEPLMKEMKDLREKMDVKRRANMEEFEKILTPEQKTKFEEMKKKGPRGEDGFKSRHSDFEGKPRFEFHRGHREPDLGKNAAEQ